MADENTVARSTRFNTNRFPGFGLRSINAASIDRTDAPVTTRSTRFNTNRFPGFGNLSAINARDFDSAVSEPLDGGIAAPLRGSFENRAATSFRRPRSGAGPNTARPGKALSQMSEQAMISEIAQTQAVINAFQTPLGRIFSTAVDAVAPFPFALAMESTAKQSNASLKSGLAARRGPKKGSMATESGAIAMGFSGSGAPAPSGQGGMGGPTGAFGGMAPAGAGMG